MMKKLTLLAMAVGALIAFAVPAMASANVTLTDEGGQPVAVNSKITAYSVNTETTSKNGNLVCPWVGITGNVAENGTAVRLDEVEVTLPTECTFAGFLPSHVSASIDEIELTTGGAGTAYGVAFSSLITGVGATCNFSGNEEGSLAVSWSSGAISIGGAGNNLVASGAGCPTEAEIHGDFGLFSDDEHTEELTLE